MKQRRGTSIRSFAGSHLLLCSASVEIAFALAIIVALTSGQRGPLITPAADRVLGFIAGGLVILAIYTSLRGIRAEQEQRSRTRRLSELMETVSQTSQEWLWAVDDQGNFTYSSSASSTLLGYDPSELIGRPCSMVIDLDELAIARHSVSDAVDDHSSGWSGLIVACRHRNGAPAWLEVAGRSRPAREGLRAGFEGTSRLLPTQTARMLVKKSIKERIDGTLQGRMILTAFQPIHELATGSIIGAEALARFPSDDSRSPEHWFDEAATVGLGGDLEFAALESALETAGKLPSHLYVALNLSPKTCLDPRLPGFLEQSPLTVDRIVLELTERLAVDEYGPLIAALAPLRRCGLRVAVDDAGSGFASMRHILQLRPDIIKLDRSLVAGIDDDAGQYALGAAMVGFAKQIGSSIVAEGIETSGELAAVTKLGMAAGQGYFLGRPTVDSLRWEAWGPLPLKESDAR